LKKLTLTTESITLSEVLKLAVVLIVSKMAILSPAAHLLNFKNKEFCAPAVGIDLLSIQLVATSLVVCWSRRKLIGGGGVEGLSSHFLDGRSHPQFQMVTMVEKIDIGDGIGGFGF
jgi:hypothetical protein